jgi:hypothetical protein
MLYYPQLPTGSIAQYPITRNNIRRTVINSLADGTQIAMADPGAAAVRWTLSYSDLTAAELSALQQLFTSTSGRWNTFGFLDPTDNLLTWSEDLSQAQWEADPLLTISGSVPDPLAGTSAWQLTNTAQTNQGILQTLAIPSSNTYCVSAYVRASAPCSFDVVANSLQQTASAGLAWTRIVCPFSSMAETGSLAVGFRLPAGSSIDVFGMQLEAQPDAGGYKKTRNMAGVYPNTRFDQDLLTNTATGTNQFRTTLKMVSNVPG